MKLQKTVLIGISGGVDSSVAALLLQKQGYRVVGAFMKNFSDTKNKYTGECQWIEEKQMAERICALIGIELIMIDYEKEYKKTVIEPMIKSYSRGFTPNPDVDCNNQIKFPALWEKAQEIRADYIATGHYAQIKKVKSEYRLLQGKDKTKDQSYFLYHLSQKDLEHTLFPLGNLTKTEVRQIAKKNHFPNHDKKGSKGICFVGKVNMQDFLSKHIKTKQGKVLDNAGNTLGSHSGASSYTIGQRVGPHIGINIEKPIGTEEKRWFVSSKRGNTLIIAPKEHASLKIKSIKIKKIHLLVSKIPKNNIKVRIRHLGQLISGKLVKNKSLFSFIFSKPQLGIAPGQDAVLYYKNQVLGGGEISL